VLAVTVGSCFFLCVVWLFLLKRYTRAIVWASYVIGLQASTVLLFYVCSELDVQYTDSTFLFPAACILVSTLMVVLRRDSINKAARVLALTCTAVDESPALVTFTLLLSLLQVAFFALYIYTSVLAYFAYGVTSEPSDLGNTTVTPL
jgi:hypothetical protein